MLGISALFAVLLTAAFAVLIVAGADQRAAGRQALRSQQAVTAGQVLEKSLISLETGLRGFVATGADRALEPFTLARRVIPGQERQLTGLIADDPRQQAAVRRISVEIQDYVNLWAIPLLAIARDRITVARSIVVNTTGRQRIDGIRASFAALFARERAVALSRERRAERRSHRAAVLGGVGIAVVLGLIVGLALWLRRSLIRPVVTVSNATDVVAAGDLTARVPAERADELGNLARGFNAMTAALERNREELSARTESLERSREELSRRSSELERSNRDLEDYASVASHDLQGPLVTISMYADLLGRRMRDSGNADSELAERITAAAQRMRTLVRDLLTYSRLGRGEMRSEEVALDYVVSDALENLAGPIEQRGAEVVVEPLPVVLGDAGQLSQVMQNLVSNAVKFSDEDTPVVRIGASVDGDHAQVSVADNGIGISPDHAERIFRPFHRLHSTDRYEGSGIGLAICERIVSQHGGRIWAESTPDEGSTFRFTVPLVSEAPAPEPGSADAERVTQA